MKIVIINGSARKGNTLTAINTFIKGAAEHNEIEIFLLINYILLHAKAAKPVSAIRGA